MYLSEDIGEETFGLEDSVVAKVQVKGNADWASNPALTHGREVCALQHCLPEVSSPRASATFGLEDSVQGPGQGKCRVGEQSGTDSW